MAWRQRFPSNRCEADRCFVADAFRKRQRQADSNRHQLAPFIGLIYDFGHNNSSAGFVMQERKQFVVTCKDCHRAVPSGAKEFPFHSIELTCPLCGEPRRYLPSEIFLSRPDRLVTRQQRAGDR